MKNLILGVLLLAILIHACTEPVSVGRDFIDDDLVDLLEVDTHTLNTRTTLPEPAIVYDSIPAITTFLAGNLNDPIFGNSRSEIFGELRVAFPGVEIPENRTVDSVVFGLALDTLSGFGNFLQEAVDVELYRLSEEMEIRQRYLSDKTFMTEPTPIGGIYNQAPNFKDEVIIYRPNATGDIDTIQLPPQFRIPIDRSIGEELLSYDSTVYSNVDEFTQLFKGVNIRVNSQQSMLGFRLFNTEGNNTSSTLTVYYREDDTIPRTLTLGFRDEAGFLSSVIPSFSHDYTGSIVEPFIGDSLLSDSLLFSQGMGGVEFTVEFPYIDQFEDALVNYAELSFTVATLPQDDLLTFPPAEPITAVFNSDGLENILVIDAAEAERIGREPEAINSVFGGYVEEEMVNGMTLRHYNMKLSIQASQMMQGQLPKTIRIRLRNKNQSAERVVVYGPGHSQHPMQFKTYLSTP